MTVPSRRAFTLTELLVVVAIISLLIGLLIPAIGMARQAAYKVVCASNQRQIALAMWTYIGEFEGHLPIVESPMHNNAFGDPCVPDEQTDPFNQTLWPDSLPHELGPYMNDVEEVYECPGSLVGWPREAQGRMGRRMTYRAASQNQPNGMVSAPQTYFRETFGFLDGRRYERLEFEPTNSPMQMALDHAIRRSTFAREMILRDGDDVVGPHQGGINVINRNLEVEFRDEKTANEDLAPSSGGVKF